MSRSSKKGPYVDQNILKKISRLKPGDLTPVKTWARASEIAPEMVGYVLAIHNGKTFINVTMKEEMVGHRVGEFAQTRKFTKHGGKMQRELEAANAAAEAAKAAAQKTNEAANSAAPKK
ncbi:MAG: 30S ribosomal protein S19 [Candidatus Harrisonbacteria bacterium]|nr:30S ribosomal protein S19 [Candidatus Harrisonbacteria bacterium]MBI2406118.1 30S ribosomal protein S19 [Candidatus Harrisonbacteria bacterium]MBI2604130.1 30S ribosomal protein S19 [Candidatus Harrisonbacteria bacterium]MBI3114455.1 30S ribosomal protein S19 [Candidatus Harrisonbacteria bacterium]